MQQRDSSPSQSYFWPTVLAVGLHVIIFGMLFVSFSMTPELPPSKPIVQATLYQLKSQSQATTQTNQKIAGEAKKTAAKQYEAEQMEQRKIEQQKQAAAKAAEQKKAEEARKAEAAKAAADKAAAARKAEEAKKVEQQKQAEIAKKKAAEELAKKKAAEEAKKKAAEEAKKKAAEEAKKKAAAEAAKKKAAEEAKKKAAAEAARKAAEDKKAQALAELLSDTTERQQAMADTHGDQVAGNFDDLIRLRAAEGWTRPPSARNNMTVQLQVNMLPDGTITNVSVSRSSGDVPFDNSAVAAVKNIGRLTEMQGLSPQEFQPYRSFKMTFTPEDLAL
ncbi:cell envelope integrity inner membrane protein TolA [Streptococcus pneumoniae]|uniref:Cell envelope integrity protein TolA n=2 Tax=Stutzerimonas stutzeri TaxID=316 RepID=A0AA42P8F8_STUST|nr:cell envelope integrity protein TolA [Stutzerimonas stutzeri]OHC18277.1 MAG: protein TolA [Pseudomonadales bacterium RIFCSPHIGHO2_01_FULL_64_12]CJL09052.1 cell envelope integrity inner membrane protein TolA [Streptococcus pneumoniae]AEJ06107.1 biopolymer transport protein TolA [Stutzerimonas stutzeri]MBH3352563.1 cell envelope integrity protein TolA [Stutzerimonas stutzeri]MCF0016493.1 cell envelope integrity protein TolA [Stutzerimonas stutzeri]